MIYLYNISFTIVHSIPLIMNNEKHFCTNQSDEKKIFTNSPNQSGKFNDQRPLSIFIRQKLKPFKLNLFNILSDTISRKQNRK
jgi:hypothetical protein